MVGQLYRNNVQDYYTVPDIASCAPPSSTHGKRAPYSVSNAPLFHSIVGIYYSPAVIVGLHRLSRGRTAYIAVRGTVPGFRGNLDSAQMLGDEQKGQLALDDRDGVLTNFATGPAPADSFACAYAHPAPASEHAALCLRRNGKQTTHKE